MRPPHGDRSSEEKDYVDSWVNDTVSSTQVMQYKWDGKMIMNAEQARIWKEMVVAY